MPKLVNTCALEVANDVLELFIRLEKANNFLEERDLGITASNAIDALADKYEKDMADLEISDFDQFLKLNLLMLRK